ncbi:MAG: hypothetical protein E7466_04330 [Ruminococcaceae bacterium]|nr:hypothetical protein [Oscillospiraceae bacterium]
MDLYQSFTIEFSGIRVGFSLPEPIELPQCFQALLTQTAGEPNQMYEVRLLTEPLPIPTAPVHTHGDTAIYSTDKGWLHIHTPLGDSAGCQVACLFCPNGHHILYYPASRWDYYARVWRCGHLIQGERLLLAEDALLLHSSAVLHQGKTVLFSGPSGAGKSTQAELWRTHLGAEIINGDRTVIRKRDEEFWGGGSMWSGTSHIYRRESAPIAGIFLLTQAPENRVRRLGAEAFAPLFSQTIVNSWDPVFVDRITDLFVRLLERVPVYRLCCRADGEAVELARATLFGKESL